MEVIRAYRFRSNPLRSFAMDLSVLAVGNMFDLDISIQVAEFVEEVGYFHDKNRRKEDFELGKLAVKDRLPTFSENQLQTNT